VAERHDRRHDRAKRLERLVSIAPGTLGALALAYLDDLRLRNYSRHTVRSAAIHVRLFLTWCEERGLVEPGQLCLAVLQRYQAHLFHHRKEDGRRLSFQSQWDRLGGLRRFVGWLFRHGHLADNPAARLELPRLEKRLPRGVLTVEEAEAVLAQADLATPRGLRDRAVMELLYATGIRRGELERLAVEDVDFAAGLVRVVEGKGKKERLVPLSERAAAWLEKYLEEARPRLVRRRDPGTLFLGRWGEPLQGGQLGKIVHQHVAASGIAKEGSCHMFRHTLATLMLEGGADIRFVQQMLGHATIATTEIYTHVALRKLKEVHAATHPGARLSRRQRSQLGEAGADPRARLLSSLAAEAAEDEVTEAEP
jgi:integrase/recombinase XerD